MQLNTCHKIEMQNWVLLEGREKPPLDLGSGNAERKLLFFVTGGDANVNRRGK